MKLKKSLGTSIAAVMICMFFVGLTGANTCTLNLPTTPVDMVVQDGTISYFVTTLSNVPSGYDVTNGVYLGWCIDTSVTIERGTTHSVMLYSSCDPPAGLDPDIVPYEWDKVNYILNNKPETATVDEIQQAIWHYVDLHGPYTATLPGALAIIADAEANGGGFAPGPGEVVAVICYPDEPEVAQVTIIELVKPGTEGLTPGFWKTHPDVWEGYQTSDTFFDVFGVEITINAGKKGEVTNPTLLQALGAKGGINEEEGVYDALARHAVAALLNAAHPHVGYPMTEQSIIDAVAEAIGNSDYTDAEPLKDMLDTYNNLGGGIDAHGDPI
jgi:hypothetical protein